MESKKKIKFSSFNREEQIAREIMQKATKQALQQMQEGGHHERPAWLQTQPQINPLRSSFDPALLQRRSSSMDMSDSALSEDTPTNIHTSGTSRDGEKTTHDALSASTQLPPHLRYLSKGAQDSGIDAASLASALLHQRQGYSAKHVLWGMDKNMDNTRNPDLEKILTQVSTKMQSFGDGAEEFHRSIELHERKKQKNDFTPVVTMPRDQLDHSINRRTPNEESTPLNHHKDMPNDNTSSIKIHTPLSSDDHPLHDNNLDSISSPNNVRIHPSITDELVDDHIPSESISNNENASITTKKKITQKGVTNNSNTFSAKTTAEQTESAVDNKRLIGSVKKLRYLQKERNQRVQELNIDAQAENRVMRQPILDK